MIELNGLALGMEFHPDDLADYIKENGERMFSKDEAKALNEMTVKCFDICEKTRCRYMRLH